MESISIPYDNQLLEICYHLLSQIIPYSSRTVCIKINLQDNTWNFSCLGNGEWKVERFPLQWSIEEDCVLEWIRYVVDSTIKTVKTPRCSRSDSSEHITNFIEYQENIDGIVKTYRIL